MSLMRTIFWGLGLVMVGLSSVLIGPLSWWSHGPFWLWWHTQWVSQRVSVGWAVAIATIVGIQIALAANWLLGLGVLLSMLGYGWPFVVARTALFKRYGIRVALAVGWLSVWSWLWHLTPWQWGINLVALSAFFVYDFWKGTKRAR